MVFNIGFSESTLYPVSGSKLTVMPKKSGNVRSTSILGSLLVWWLDMLSIEVWGRLRATYRGRQRRGL
jgi:hypothetical protein